MIARSALLIISLLLLVAPAFGASRDVTWDDLLPGDDVAFDDPFAVLSEEQLRDLSMVVRIRWLIESDKAAPDGVSAAEEKRLVASLRGQGIDVEGLLSQRERVIEMRSRRMEAGAKGVIGSQIRIPGYMLPLESGADGVTRFLLVPWVGACIHTPPPPPNQMIHVSVPGGTSFRGSFAPVWVEGTIEHQQGRYDLFLVDGTRSIPVAYAMTTGSIADYSSAESDVLAQVEIPPESLSQHSLWERWQIQVSMLFTRTMTDIRDRRGSGALALGILIAFLYGIVHTLGPGHGKGVVVSYFVGEGGNLARGVGMGVKIATFHVLSAIVVVLLTEFVVRQATGQAPSDYRVVRLISYAGIAAIGLWMLIPAVRRMSRAHDHGHEHEHHGTCGCSRLEQPASGQGSSLALAIGAVPCTGALLVLLFGVANDLLWPSVLMVVAISAGMALVLSGVGCAAILGRRVVDGRLAGDPVRRLRVTTLLRVGAAGGVLMIGSTLFVLTWASPSPTEPGASDRLSAGEHSDRET